MNDMPDAASVLARLMRWYEAQCDGEWEHEFGLRIETMDIPGWSVAIDLAFTGVPPEAITPRNEQRSKHDWIECSVRPGCVFTSDGEGQCKFVGYGGPHNLAEILEYFLRFADA